MDDLDEILDDNVAIERDSLDYLDDILELNDEELEPCDDCEVLDDEFIESHLIPVNATTIQNFPFVEDDVDAITDYELFSKGFGYLDDKKADKEELSEYVKKDEIPPLDDFVTKDTTELENYTLTEDLSEVALTGDYDDLINKPTIPVVPTNISAFNNDSGYITKDVNDLTNYTLTSSLSSVATSGSYNDLSNKPTIPVVPTNISAFTNDSGYITKDVNDLTNYTLSSNLSSVATSGSYNDLSNKPTIPTVPTNISAFTNDSGYITKNVNDLTNYTLTSSLSSVATSGNYNDLSNKPTIPDVSNFITKDVNNLTYYTDTTTLTTLLAGKEDVMEIGSNTNGNYIKFANGILICYKSHPITTSMTSSWGGWYESPTQNLGSFPVNFIAKPIIQATVSYGTAAIESILSTSTNSWGSTILYRPVSTSSYTYYVDLIAIGKWK